MPETADRNLITACTSDHPAFCAWRELRPGSVAPDLIEVLDLQPQRSFRGKSLVCRLRGVGPSGSAIVGKRCRAAKALAEHTIYHEILPQLPVEALHCFGVVMEPDGEHGWLFLEDAGGEPYSDQDHEHRVLGALWLGRMHTTAPRLAIAAQLADRGPGHYLRHMHAGCDTIRRHLDNPALRAEDIRVLKTILSHCDIVASCWLRIESVFDGAPRTLVHGDFVAKNVRVRTGNGKPTLMLLDWETAGWGVAAPDLLRVDLPTYCSVVERAWPAMDLRVIRRQAKLGALLRYLAAIDWESGWLAYKWVTNPMQRMRRYAAGLDDALRTAAWEDDA